MTCKTFKALFDFQGCSDDTLSFKQNDLLTVVQPVDENWHFGCKNNVYGFIPVKYVKEVEENYAFMLQCITGCIEVLQKIPEKNATKDEISALKKMIKCREALCVEMSFGKPTSAVTRPAVSPPPRQSQKLSEPAKQKAPAPPTNLGETSPAKQKAPALKAGAPSPPKPQAPAIPAKHGSVSIPANLSRQLVESIRANTNAPHRDCVQAVKQLLVTLETQLADQSEDLALIIRQLAEQMMRSAAEELVADGKLDATITESGDWKAFNRLLSRAEARRQDWQERGGWSLHEREAQILGDLTQLADLLAACQPSVARLRIRLDGCSGPLCLAELHSAETRRAIRLALVDCLAHMCALDRQVVDALLGHTTLPTDLLTAVASASDGGVPSGGESEAGLKKCLHLLALVFSTNLRPPNAVFESLNEQFFVKLLSHLASEDCSESLVLSIVAFLLTVNNLTSGFAGNSLPVQERPLFRALLAVSSACRQALVEAILVAFNRAADPADLLTHSPPQQDSVVKMLIDLLSHESIVSSSFYTGDIHVLIDVLTRELYNASSDNRRLPQLLQLLRVASFTSAYRNSLHKRDDLVQALKQLHDQDAMCQLLRSTCRSLWLELQSC